MCRTSVRCSLVVFLLATNLAVHGVPIEPLVGLQSNPTIVEIVPQKSASQEVDGSSDALSSTYDTHAVIDIAKGAKVPVQTKNATKDNDDDASVPDVIPLQNDGSAPVAHVDNTGDKKEIGTNPENEKKSIRIPEPKEKKLVENESEISKSTGKMSNENPKKPNTNAEQSNASAGNIEKPTGSKEKPSDLAGSSETITITAKSTTITATENETNPENEETPAPTDNPAEESSGSLEPTSSTTLKPESSSTETTTTKTTITKSTSPATEVQTTVTASSTEETAIADDPQQSKKPIAENDEGMPSGIIALVMAIVFAVVVIFVYVGLLIWRRYLEYRYGNRELLVNDLEFDTNDLRHFEL